MVKPAFAILAASLKARSQHVVFQKLNKLVAHTLPMRSLNQCLTKGVLAISPQGW